MNLPTRGSRSCFANPRASTSVLPGTDPGFISGNGGGGYLGGRGGVLQTYVFATISKISQKVDKNFS